MSTDYLFPPPPVVSATVQGEARRFPIHRLFFVGRNYHAHAVEMGRPVDKSAERPFYFTKSPSTLVESGANVPTVPYPSGTNNYHFEMELVVAIGSAGFRVPRADAGKLVYGYACGLDMTRRDLQLVARDKGRPWDLGKDVEQSSILSSIVPMPGKLLDSGEIALSVDGIVKQQSDLNKLIWNVAEIIEDLSQFYHLQPGDVIYTGTPEGVGAVLPGQRIDGHIDGVGRIAMRVGPAD